MSAIEKPVLTPPATAPALAPGVQREHAPTPLSRSKWQKFDSPALVVLLAAAIVRMRNLGPTPQLGPSNRWAAEGFGEDAWQE